MGKYEIKTFIAYNFNNFIDFSSSAVFASLEKENVNNIIKFSVDVIKDFNG